MKKNRGKTACFLGMAILFTGVLLTGCGGKKGSQQEVKMDKEHIYKADYFKAPKQVENINHVVVKGDKIYADGYSMEGNGEYCLVSLNKDGKVETKFQVKTDNSEKGYTNILAFAVKGNGEVAALSQQIKFDVSKPDVVPKESNELITYGKDGKKKGSVKIKYKGEEGFYPNRMLIDKDNHILAVMNHQILIYSEKGKQIAEIEVPQNDWINSVFQVKGKTYVSKYHSSGDKGATEIVEVDVKNKKFSDPIPVAIESSSYTYFSGDENYDFYLRDSSFLYGYQMEEKKMEKLCNWVDSDINGNSIQDVSCYQDGRFLLINNSNEGKTEFALIEKVDPKDVVEKKMLSLACIYADYDLYNQVIEFNKSNDKYRITINDYSMYNTDEDYNKANTQLRNDIVSGKTPDLWSVSNVSFLKNIANKGMLMDIYELMEADKGFKRGDYMENILESGAVNGKLYMLIPNYSVTTVAGKTKVVGKESGWNIDEMMKIYKKQKKGTKIFNSDVTKSMIMYYGAMLSLQDFMDWEKGTCSFDSEEFIKLLQFTDEFPKDNDTGAATVAMSSEEDQSSQYRSGKTMLSMPYLYNFDSYHQLLKEEFADKVTLKGFPNASRNGSYIQPALQLAVFENTSNKEACWEFLKVFLDKEHQDHIEYGWPVKLSSLEKMKQDAMKPRTYEDNGKVVEDKNIAYIDGKEVNIGYPDEKECDTLIAFLKTLNQTVNYDDKVNTIITEESAAYFEGQKTAEETAKIIQDRVKTYMGESK